MKGFVLVQYFFGNFKCGGEHSQIVHFFAIADSTLKEYEMIGLIYYRKNAA